MIMMIPDMFRRQSLQPMSRYRGICGYASDQRVKRLCGTSRDGNLAVMNGKTTKYYEYTV